MNRLFFTLIVVVGCILQSYGQDRSKVLELVKSYLPNDDIGMSVGIFDGDQVRTVRIGYADKAAKKLIDSSTIFRSDVLCRALTRLLLARMANSKSIEPMKTLGQYIDIPRNSPVSQITLLDLTTGRIGLPDASKLTKKYGTNGQALSQEQLLQAVANLKSVEEQPSLYYRSEAALVRSILSKVCHMPFQKLLQDSLYTPLGFHLPLSPGLESNFAVGYNQKGIEKPFESLLEGAELPVTVSDVLVLLSAELTPSPTPIGQAITISQEQYRFSKLGGHGLFWIVAHLDNNAVVDYGGPVVNMYYMSGRSAGFSSFIGIIPQYRKAVVLLSNKEIDTIMIGVSLLTNLVFK